MRSPSLLLLSTLVMACSSSSSSSTPCPDDEPLACTMPAPSYKTDVAPILLPNCVAGCHSPGGTSSDKPLVTYDDVFQLRATVLSQLATCAMPQPPSPALTSAERAIVFDWLVCNAPNN